MYKKNHSTTGLVAASDDVICPEVDELLPVAFPRREGVGINPAAEPVSGLEDRHLTTHIPACHEALRARQTGHPAADHDYFDARSGWLVLLVIIVLLPVLLAVVWCGNRDGTICLGIMPPRRVSVARTGRRCINIVNNAT